MQSEVYELVSMGFRYIFVALILLTLWRAFRLMAKDRRQYKKTLRQLPDAGLIGELVSLETGQSFPLAREGMIGSGHSCDIRLPLVRRRELEFYFQPGYGVRLIPIHHKERPLLDDELIARQPAHALHGTVMQLKGKPYRFRLFAGLDVPERMVTAAPVTPSMALEEVDHGTDWELPGVSGFGDVTGAEGFLETQPMPVVVQSEPVMETNPQIVQESIDSSTPVVEETPPLPLSLEEEPAFSQPVQTKPMEAPSWAEMTWQYAPFPNPESMHEEQKAMQKPGLRNRRARRHQTDGNDQP